MLFTESANTSRELIISLVIAMVSSIILLMTIFFIIFGCVCGRLWQKRKQSKETSDIKDAHLQPSQTEHASSATGHATVSAEQDLEMMENVAYGPLKWTTTQ